MTAFAVFLVLCPWLPCRADFEAVGEFRFVPCTRASIREFRELLSRDRSEADAQLSKKYDGNREKIEKHPIMVAIALMETTAADLVRRVDAGEAPERLEPSFGRLQRLRYSTRAQMDPYADPPMLVLGWKCGGNLLFGPLKLTTRTPDPNRPLGRSRAMLEAARLTRPGTGKPVSIEEMASMNAVEVSRLEPVADHPALRPVTPGDHYSAFLADLTRLIRKTGKKAERFDFAYARRILFFDELKTDASSPKIKVKDRYGISWKMKWGDEVHSDVVATRLAMELGATYVDPKFWSGPGESLLILPKSADRSAPSTREELESLLLKSSYKFHLERYIADAPILTSENGARLGTGRVDEAMIERESLDAKYLGCIYLAFKECQLTIDNPALKRLGGVDLNRGASLDDRVARSSVVFNTWINNPDVKEDNTRGGLLLDPNTGAFSRYVEFLSDMGASFAGPYSSGCLSTLSPNCVGEVFKTQFMKTHPIFLPDCWRNCTWADARWMARRIAALRRQDLERVFADSGWPAYAQQLGVEKLLARRNDLVRAFDLTEEGDTLESCNPSLTIRIQTPDGVEMPVVRGMINPLSRLVRKDETTAHPEGLLLSRPRQID